MANSYPGQGNSGGPSRSPVDNNQGVFPKQGAPQAPIAGSNMGVDLSRTSFRNPVPTGNVGTPMDSAPTCPPN